MSDTSDTEEPSAPSSSSSHSSEGIVHQSKASMLLGDASFLGPMVGDTVGNEDSVDDVVTDNPQITNHRLNRRRPFRISARPPRPRFSSSSLPCSFIFLKIYKALLYMENQQTVPPSRELDM